MDFSERTAYPVPEALHGGGPRVAIAIDAYQLAHLVAAVWRAKPSGDWHQQVLWKLTHAAEALGVGRAAPLVSNDGTKMRWHPEPRQWVEVLS